MYIHIYIQMSACKRTKRELSTGGSALPSCKCKVSIVDSGKVMVVVVVVVLVVG